MSVVIAHFSKIRVCIWTAANLVVAIPFCVAVFYPPQGVSFSAHLFSREGLYDPLTIVGIAVIPLLMTVLFVMLRQLLFREGDAMWISDGRLYFLNFYGGITFSSLILLDIEDVSAGSKKFLQPTGVMAQLKHGSCQYLPTVLLSEPRDTVLLRLKECWRSQKAP